MISIMHILPLENVTAKSVASKYVEAWQFQRSFAALTHYIVHLKGNCICP